MIQRIAFAALLALALPQAALALSCMRSDVEVTYARAAAAEESYMLVRGTLEFNTRKLPKPLMTEPNSAPELTRIKARLRGTAMSKRGFDTPISRQITLAVRCLGPWCGGFVPGEEHLMFLRREAGDGWLLEQGPCGGWAFGGDTQAHAKTAYACYTSGRCTSTVPKMH